MQGMELKFMNNGVKYREHAHCITTMFCLATIKSKYCSLKMGFGTIYNMWFQTGNIPTYVLQLLLKENFLIHWGEWPACHHVPPPFHVYIYSSILI